MTKAKEGGKRGRRELIQLEASVINKTGNGERKDWRVSNKKKEGLGDRNR